MLLTRKIFVHIVHVAAAATILSSAASAETLDVSFPSFDGFVLEGTFYRPSISVSIPPTVDVPPAPGVGLIHGSGPQSREANLNSQVGMMFPFSIPAFAEIATELQQHGIAVLTYDKRTCGAFNNCYNNSYPMPTPEDLDTINVFLSDAQAALEYLQGREEVDSDRIVSIGHSQSGSFVPILMRDGPDGVVGGVVLQGPFHPVDDLLAYQLNYTLHLVEDLYGLNATEAMQVPQVGLLAAITEGVAAIRDGTSDDAIGGASASFWRSWFDLSEEAQSAAAVVDQPLFILNGQLDTNVPVKEAYAWEEYLGKSGKSEYRVELLDCVTHALNCLSQSDMTQFDPETDIGREVDPKVHDALVSFVLNVTSGDDDDVKEEDEEEGDDPSGGRSGASASAWGLRLQYWSSIYLLGAAFSFLR